MHPRGREARRSVRVLQGSTDGEFRRTFFHVDFLEQFEGVEPTYGEFAASFQKTDGSKVEFMPPTMHVDGKVNGSDQSKAPTSDFPESNDDALAKVWSFRRRCCISAAGARR